MSNNQLLHSNKQHLMVLAKCHKLCFPNSLSTKLGLNYIAKTFDWFLNDDNKFIYHLQNSNGEIVGYCGGFVSKGIGDGSSSGMLQHAFKEAVIGMVKKPWLIFNKEVVEAYPFILKNIKRKIFPASYSKSFVRYNKDEPKYAGLVVIAVHPAYRGKGIFEELMNQFFIEAKQKGAIGGSLSVRKDNERGIGAYTKSNWKIVKEDKHTFVMQIIIKH